MFLKKQPTAIFIAGIKGDQSSSKIQALLKDGAPLIRTLINEASAVFHIQNDELIVNINNVKAFVECEEDLFILNEVFNNLVYGFHSAETFVVIDIGLNIGISSLYFNQRSNVEKIYAYEPVTETYHKCLRNLKLNDNPSKIITVNLGLGNSDREDRFTYSSTFKGSVGSVGLSKYKQANSPEIKFVNVNIKKASTVISEIIHQNPNKKFMIKMDCEGGEYEILPDLFQSDMLDKIDLLVLEWHELEFLDKLNYLEHFNCFYNKNSATTGMLYAFKKAE